ncbi:hypothetical protein Tco_0178961 [Tanacetum coccineum]
MCLWTPKLLNTLLQLKRFPKAKSLELEVNSEENNLQNTHLSPPLSHPNPNLAIQRRKLSANKESRANDISQKVKLEDLSDILKDTRSAFFTPDSPTNEPIIVSDKSEEEEAKKAEQPSSTSQESLEERTGTPKGAAAEAEHYLPTKLQELLSKVTELSKEIKELKQHVKDMKLELPGDLKDIPSKLETFTSIISSLSSQVAELKIIQWELPAEFFDLPHLVSSVQEQLKTLDSLLSLLKKLTNTLNREVIQACPNRKEKGWKTIYELIKTRMEYLEQTEKELHIDFNKSLQEQDPLDELNDLANKKRKRTGDSTTILVENAEVPSASALQVLRRLGSIFTSVYAAKVYNTGKRLLYAKRNKAISLGKGASKVSREAVLRALHLKWGERSPRLKIDRFSSLALEELIGNLKVHMVIMEKDFEIYKGKKGKVKSIALKAKKESSDDETSSSDSEDEEYAMAVRDFKNFFRGCLVGVNYT